MNFDENYRSFLNDFGNGWKAVLSTAENNIVSSRMMSIVQINGIFYFQTDKTFRKYRQLTQNRNVALCIDNIQIEGEAEEIGHPLKTPTSARFLKSASKARSMPIPRLKMNVFLPLDPHIYSAGSTKTAHPISKASTSKRVLINLNSILGYKNGFFLLENFSLTYLLHHCSMLRFTIHRALKLQIYSLRSWIFASRIDF